MGLPFDPAIPLVEIYLKEPKTPIEKNLCTPMFIAVLFTTAQFWNQHKCPTVDEWIKKLWYIYAMEYYSTIKKQENLTFCNSMGGPGEYYVKLCQS